MNCFSSRAKLSEVQLLLSRTIFHKFYPGYATPKVTKYQRCNFIIQIHQFTIKIDKININLLFECVKIVEFNFNSHVFHVMYQETRFLNQDACFLNQEGRRQVLISFVSEGDLNRKICHASWIAPPVEGGGVLPYITYTGMCRPTGS